MHSYRRELIGGLVLLVGLLLAPPAFAEATTVERSDYGYQISVPSGWGAVTGEEVPAEIHRRFEQRLKAGGKHDSTGRHMHVDSVIYPEGATDDLAEVSVVVTVLDNRKMDLKPSDMPDAFVGAVKAAGSRGLTLREADFDKPLPVIEPGEALQGKHTRQIIRSQAGAGPDGKSYRSDTWMKMGDAHSVTLAINAPEAVWPKFADARQTIYGGFAITHPRELRNTGPTASSYQEEGAKLGRFCVFAFIGLVAFFAYAFKNG